MVGLAPDLSRELRREIVRRSEQGFRLSSVPLQTTSAVRYVNPMREGGSMPGLIEASDGKLYVVKMRGAGQGPLALAAEVIAGEIARTLGLSVPKIVLVELQPSFGRQERDAEIRDLLRASPGINMGIEFLSGSTTFDPAAGDIESSTVASMIVWLDAYVMNVDRTSRNPNLLRYLHETWLIDHGASLYFHHDWETADLKVVSPFAMVRDHVLLPWADDLAGASGIAHQRISEAELKRIADLVPADWLTSNNRVPAEAWRERYVRFLSQRLENSFVFEEEVRRARPGSL